MFTENELNLLMKIRIHPELYLGKKSLDLLHIFLLGYRYAVAEYKKNDDEPSSSSSKCFQQFVMDRYSIYSYYNAYGIIRLQCENDADALDLFYELLDEFIALN